MKKINSKRESAPFQKTGGTISIVLKKISEECSSGTQKLCGPVCVCVCVREGLTWKSFEVVGIINDK